MCLFLYGSGVKLFIYLNRPKVVHELNIQAATSEIKEVVVDIKMEMIIEIVHLNLDTSIHGNY